jgi:hypothetical protein
MEGGFREGISKMAEPVKDGDIDHNLNPKRKQGAKKEQVCYPDIGSPSSPPPDTVLINDVMESGAVVPGRTFFDDLDEFAGVLADGIPARHQRLRMHGVLMNAARILGWIPDDDNTSTEARAKLLEAWRRIVEKTPAGNIAVSAGEAVEDFRRHLYSSSKGGTLKAFHPRMPDFTTLPTFGDIRGTARCLRRRILSLMNVGVLPILVGDETMRRHVASGAARIVVEVLCPLARRVPRQCLIGTASIPAARMQAMCPSRLHYKTVVAWLADAKILRMTHPYILPNKFLGGGRPRLYFVNLPLVVWLAGVGKGRLSWTAREPSARPQVATVVAGEGRNATGGPVRRVRGGCELRSLYSEMEGDSDPSGR